MTNYVSNARQSWDVFFQAILWSVALALWAYNISAVTTLSRKPIDNLVWFDGHYRNYSDDCVWHECTYQNMYWIEDCEGNKYEHDTMPTYRKKYVVYVKILDRKQGKR
jgi:hypothetical protein